MDFGNSIQALNSKTHHDFDLNWPSTEELNWNTENEFSPLIQMNSSQNDTEEQNMNMNMNMLAANNGDNEVHQSSVVDTTPAGSHAAAAAAADDMRVKYKYITSLEPAGPGRSTLSCRRRYRRRGEIRRSDPSRYCTNSTCRTRKTPLWRKGPLGPKTLCNACGIHYMKQVSRGGNGVDLAVPVMDGVGDASPSALPAHGDASPSALPAETERRGPKF